MANKSAIALILLPILTALLADGARGAVLLRAPANAPPDRYVLAAASGEDEGDDLVIDDEIQRQRLILDIQELLTELGLYHGPLDGIVGAGTGRAIRIYQDQTKLLVDGRATPALLKHLQTVGQANRLVRRIASVKERKIDQARAALARRSETRALLRRGTVEPADPTRDASGCLAAPNAGCLLDEALESAKAVADRRFRDWALGDIVVAQIKADFPALAFDTVGRIDDPRLIITGLRNIAQIQASRGRLPESRAMAELIPELWGQLQAKVSIALAEAGAGNADAALLTARDITVLSRRLDRPARTVAALGQLATRLRKAGAVPAADLLLEEALEFVTHRPMSDADRQNSLSEVAVAVAEGGDLNRARHLIENVDADALRRPVLLAAAGVLARGGDGGEALQAAAEIRDARYRSVALSEVAIALVNSGATEEAREITNRALRDITVIDERFTYAKGYATSRAAAALIELGALSSAFDAARTIGEPALRAKALWRVAAAQARDGKDASGTFALAHDAVADINSALDRAWTYCSIASASAEAGDHELGRQAFNSARDIVATIRSPWARANAFTKLASTLLDIQ